MNNIIRHRNNNTDQKWSSKSTKTFHLLLQQSFSPLSFAWVLVFLLRRAAKPISSLGSAFSASSPNSIFIMTSSLYNYRNEVKQNVTFIWGVCCANNCSKTDIRLRTHKPVLFLTVVITKFVKIYLDFPAPLAFSFLKISLPVSLSFHGAGNARDNTATLRRGHSLLLHLHCFAFCSPLFNRHGGILFFFCLNALSTRRNKIRRLSSCGIGNMLIGQVIFPIPLDGGHTVIDHMRLTRCIYNWMYRKKQVQTDEEPIPPVPLRKQPGLPSKGLLEPSSSGCSALSSIEQQPGQKWTKFTRDRPI